MRVTPFSLLPEDVSDNPILEGGYEVGKAFLGSPGDLALTMAGPLRLVRGGKIIKRGIEGAAAAGLLGAGAHDISKGDYLTGGARMLAGALTGKGVIKKPVEVIEKGTNLTKGLVDQGQTIANIEKIHKGKLATKEYAKRLQVKATELAKDMADAVGGKPEEFRKESIKAARTILRQTGTPPPSKVKLDKATQPFPEVFKNWVGLRSAADIAGQNVRREFADLEKLGEQGILDYQAGKLKDLRIKKVYDDWFAKVKGVLPETEYRDKYLPQLWEETPDVVRDKLEQAIATGKKVTSKPGFTMKRVYDDYKEGIDAGLTPKYKTVTDLMAWYESRANKALADSQFVQYEPLWLNLNAF